MKILLALTLSGVIASSGMVGIPIFTQVDSPEMIGVPIFTQAETPGEKVSTENTRDQETVKNIISLVNQNREKIGLKPFVIEDKLTLAANTRAKELAENFSHTRSNGQNFSTALRDVGVSYRGAGENIAQGLKTASDVMNIWMNSGSQRENVLNQNFNKMGVGYYESLGESYWVQIFAY